MKDGAQGMNPYIIKKKSKTKGRFIISHRYGGKMIVLNPRVQHGYGRFLKQKPLLC